MLRLDIADAVHAAPDNIQAELTVSGEVSLNLLNDYLSDAETVEAIISASVRPGVPTTCLLAITNRRLIFVAPAPQAVGWQLPKLTKSQVSMGYAFIEGDAGEYSVGVQASEWATESESKIKRASAAAVLAGW